MKTAISFAVWCLLLAGCSSRPKTCAKLSKQVDSTSEFVQRHIQEELNKLRRAGPAENRSPYIEEMKSNAIYGAESLKKRSGEIVSCTCSEQERIDLKASRLRKKAFAGLKIDDLTSTSHVESITCRG